MTVNGPKRMALRVQDMLVLRSGSNCLAFHEWERCDNAMPLVPGRSFILRRVHVLPSFSAGLFTLRLPFLSPFLHPAFLPMTGCGYLRLFAAIPP